MNILFAASARFPGRVRTACHLVLLLLPLVILLGLPHDGRATGEPAPPPPALTPETKDTTRGFPLGRQRKQEALPATPLEKGQRILLTPFLISAPLDERVTPANPKAWEQRFLSSLQRAFQQQGFAVQVMLPETQEIPKKHVGSQPRAEGAAPSESPATGTAGSPPTSEGKPLRPRAAQTGSAVTMNATAPPALGVAPETASTPAPTLHNSVTGTLSGELHTITVYPLQVVAVAGRERMNVKAQVTGTVTLFQETEKRAFLISKPVEGFSNINMKSNQDPGAQNGAAQRALEEALDNCAANLVRTLMEP